MSAKKHILVPRSFTAADLTPHLNLEKFHRMTRQEANKLAHEGRIHELSPKVWQLTEESLTHPDRETGEGRVSREIPFALQSFMESEMRGSRAWCVTI